jgi:hypothetical protein
MNNEALFLFLILLLGLVLCSFLGGNCGKEGFDSTSSSQLETGSIFTDASGNTITNEIGNNDFIFNLNNVITEGGPYNIPNSYVFYTNYKTLTVGKAHCDYTSLYTAINSINDNSSNTR